jgi:glycosyltransferase involved in cell wall biosynthesis
MNYKGKQINGKRLFVVIPSLQSAGPIKGAIALCNGIAEYIDVTLVPLKPTHDQPNFFIDHRVKLLSFANLGWKEKVTTYREVLIQAGGRGKTVSLSFCLQADTLNFFMAKYSNIISSVRGNLTDIYRLEYGLKGSVAAYFHLLLLRRFDYIIAISHAMAQQLKRFGIRRLITIGNFIDESNMEGFRFQCKDESDRFRFIYLARLTRGKRPDLLIDTIRLLFLRGIECHLDIVGDGPLHKTLESRVKDVGLSPWITFHGHLSYPYDVLQKADCLVLPSESEGISRAVLEALFFGIPCIVRDVDGNRELITPGVNGELFIHDDELVEVMYKMAQNKELRQIGRNLLPDAFRQETNVQCFLKLVLS